MDLNAPAAPATEGSTSPDNWSPSSWTSKPIKQEVVYDDQAAFKKTLKQLDQLPPLVTAHEITKLRKYLRGVALGGAFVLQGGDCAELFDYCKSGTIEAKVKLLLQMSLILIWGAHKKVVRIGRIAGQFAKPRSNPFETVNGVEMPAFRGDNINGFDATPADRKPDPERLVSAYFHSAATLNYLRGSLASGLADLHSPMDWDLGHVIDPEIKAKYQDIVSRVVDALDFMRVIQLDKNRMIETAEVYTSHEGLMLEYEQSLTRLSRHPEIPLDEGELAQTPTAEKSQPMLYPSSTKTFSCATSEDESGYYATSAHFIWIGDRTRQLNGAHVEFFRGISNPIGVKVGPTMQPGELTQLLDTLNPKREIGKVTLITRYGASKIANHLPEHIRAVQASGHLPVWQCDPMHGNTRTAGASGIKTRDFKDILSELQQALQIHRSLNSYLGGMHLELTGEAVTECVGGAAELTEDRLEEHYTTFCDPRLNEKQALELAFLVAGFYRGPLDKK